MTFIIIYLFMLLIITNYFITEKLIFNISLIKIRNNTILLHNDDAIDDISMIEKIINFFKEIMYLLRFFLIKN
jgi:hypothetical protein